ncbi:MAG: lysylphosphatidylglycerol synthase transmembrane domain-containing protein [Patescibacteria group bacterium]
MKSPSSTGLKINKKQLLLALLLVIGLYVIVPQFGEFKSSWHLLSKPQPVWVLLAVLLTMLTYFAGAMTYVLLAFKRLRYVQVVLVQLAAMFVNRLLPSGIGALGANYLYLRHAKHTSTQAGSMVAINNLLGVLGHGLLVALTLLLYSGVTSLAISNNDFVGSVAKVLIVVGVLAVIMLVIFGRKKFVSTLADLRKQLLTYRRRPWRLPAALLSSVVLTLFNVLCLVSCALALGVHLPFAVILLIFSFGVGAGAVTPTPGGLGGFEAGLAAGFVAYHVASPTALAVALLYRLISYWMPLVIGALAFIVCQQKQLFLTK